MCCWPTRLWISLPACCRLALNNDGAAIGAAARTRIVRDYDWSARLRRFDDLLRRQPAIQVREAV